MSEWYSGMHYDEMDGKHVRVTLEDGTVMEGRLVYDQSDESVRLGSTQLSIPWDDRTTSKIPCPAVLVDGEWEDWHPLKGIKSLALVWDERDWERIEVKNVRHGDAVVVNGRLCTVDKAWPDDYHPQVVTVAPSRMRIDLCLVSCALRRKAKVPVKPGFYKDRTGAYWVRSFILDIDKPWRAVDSYAFDSPVRSEEEMLTLMPLTPVHFVDGRAPEPGDELASVMRITSKGVTFTTEAA